jgi:hypothetical protein
VIRVISEPPSRAHAPAEVHPALDFDEQLTTVRTRSYPMRRLVLPAVAAVVVLAVVAVFLVTRTFGHDAAPSAASAPAQIRSFVWGDPHSPGTVVYTGSTMRLFDGCRDRLARLIIRNDRLIQGATLGPASVCGGQAMPGNGSGTEQAAQRRLNHFYAVVAGPASWSRTGAVLTLTTTGKGTLRLTRRGAAPTLADMTWHLVDYMGADGYEHDAATPLTLTITTEGSFQAKLACGTVRGHATVSATRIRFGDAQPPHCADRASTVIADIIQTGDAQYTIRGNQLIITTDAGMLVYQP